MAFVTAFRKTVITGENSDVGRSIIHKFSDTGIETADLSSSNNLLSNLFKIDLTCPEQVVAFIKNVKNAMGVGQSIYEIKEYSNVNDISINVLLETLLDNPVERLVVAPSMSIYGEGLYQNPGSEIQQQGERSKKRLAAGIWEPLDKSDPSHSEAASETKSPFLASVYALSKYGRERAALIIGQIYDIPVTALRSFNVYGPRQALLNLYTGDLAIFSSRSINDNPPLRYSSLLC